MPVSAKVYQYLSCLKLFLVIFTIIYLSTGVLFLATGIYGLIALTHYFTLSPTFNISLTPILLCVIGGIVIISGLFGLVTAIKNSKCLINSYCLVLGVVFLAEVAGGISSIIFINQIEESFSTGFTQALEVYTTNKTFHDNLNRVQNELNCCGGVSYKDWTNTPWANNTLMCSETANAQKGVAVPLSCCKTGWDQGRNTSSDISQTCFCGSSDDLSNVNTNGCLEVLFGSNGQTLHYLLGATFGCALIQLISMILAICIYRKLREVKSSRRY